ncbi:MAG: hypothetical protein ACON4Q_05285 [Candidatus Puniceispirillaceae bacterium]
MRGFTMIVVLGLMLGLAGCGKRGEPMRPSEVKASIAASVSTE